MRKILAMVLSLCMLVSISACSALAESENRTADFDAGTGAPTYVMVSKTLSDPIFIDMYVGFREFCSSIGVNCMYRGTEEPTAEKEIEVITQLIAQGVKGIAVIAADFDALEADFDAGHESGNYGRHLRLGCQP